MVFTVLFFNLSFAQKTDSYLLNISSNNDIKTASYAKYQLQSGNKKCQESIEIFSKTLSITKNSPDHLEINEEISKCLNGKSKCNEKKECHYRIVEASLSFGSRVFSSGGSNTVKIELYESRDNEIYIEYVNKHYGYHGLTPFFLNNEVPVIMFDQTGNSDVHFEWVNEEN